MAPPVADRKARIMRTLIAAVPLLALSACGQAPDPGANGAVAANTAAAPAGDAGLAQWREDALRGCIGGGRERAAPNVPVEAHCACAVDREMAGKTLAELEAAERSGEYAPLFTAALRRCIAEIPPT